jgi:hypothetical protein
MKIIHKKRHNSFYPLIMGACFILNVVQPVMGDNENISSLPEILEQNSSFVTVEEIDNQTIYSISDGYCKIEWIARNSEIGVVKHLSRCNATLARQLPLIMQICTEFLARDKNAGAFRTLFWGRLTPDGSKPDAHELSFRIALAAFKSPGWDVKRGRPKNGDINGFVRDIANREMIYPELKEVFRSFNKSVRFSSAEKVLVSNAGKFPFFDQLKQHGVKASDKLPFDCMIWFSVTEISA